MTVLGSLLETRGAAVAGASAPLRENEQGTSIVKASTPEPFSASRTSNWVARVGGLPDYIQHIAHDLMEKRGKTESQAIQMAVGIVQRWARGGGNVTADTRAAAAKALAEWEAKRAASHAKSAAKGAGVRESFVDCAALAEGAGERLVVLEQTLGLERLVEAAAKAAGWAPELRKTASASNEDARFEVHDCGQHVGYVAKRKGYAVGTATKRERWHARALNGERLGDYEGDTDKSGAVERLRAHLEEGPARVAKVGSKWLVADPATYGGDGPERFRSAPSEAIARHMAGLPPKVTAPERTAQVAALAEGALVDARILAVYEADAQGLAALLQERAIRQSKREELLKKGQAIRNADGSIAYPIETVGDLENAARLARSGHGNVAAARKLVAKMARKLGVANPLAGSSGSVQEGEPLDAGALLEAALPAPLAEAFNAGELRGFHGRWAAGGARKLRALARGGGVEGRVADPRPRIRGTDLRGRPRVREPLRPGRSERPRLSEAQMVAATRRGSWTRAVGSTVTRLRSGQVTDTEEAYRVKLPGGKLGPYSAERAQLHARIVQSMLQGVGSHPSTAEAVFMAGGPAAGKSRLIRTGNVKLPADAAHINPDVVKEMLPEYQRLKAAGDPRAASLVHEESSHVAKIATNVALGQKMHVVVDTVGNSGEGRFASKVKAAQRAGYKARVVYATIPTQLAEQRAEVRAARTGRKVPVGYLRASHRAVTDRFLSEIQRLPDARVEVFDTTGKPKLIASKTPAGVMRVHDSGRYAAFVRKASPELRRA